MPNIIDDDGKQSLDDEGTDDTDTTRCVPLPDSPRPNDCLLGEARQPWSQFPSSKNRARPDSKNAWKQPALPYPTTDTGTQLWKILKNKAEKRKVGGSRGGSSEDEEGEYCADEERVVECQRRVDQESHNGPQNDLILPHYHHKDDNNLNNEVGHVKQQTTNPTQETRSNRPPLPLAVVRDIQQPSLGPSNDMGLLNQISTNNTQYKNNSPSIHNLRCGKEWKVFVRRKGCHQNQAQQRCHQLPQAKFPILDATLPSEFIGELAKT